MGSLTAGHDRLAVEPLVACRGASLFLRRDSDTRRAKPRGSRLVHIAALFQAWAVNRHGLPRPF
jgi:hypothetical protein